MGLKDMSLASCTCMWSENKGKELKIFQFDLWVWREQHMAFYSSEKKYVDLQSLKWAYNMFI